jgi:hypothetical protein
VHRQYQRRQIWNYFESYFILTFFFQIDLISVSLSFFHSFLFLLFVYYFIIYCFFILSFWTSLSSPLKFFLLPYMHLPIHQIQPSSQHTIFYLKFFNTKYTVKFNFNFFLVFHSFLSFELLINISASSGLRFFSPITNFTSLFLILSKI